MTQRTWQLEIDIKSGMPALATFDDQARCAIEVASTWHLPDAVEIQRLIDAGKLMIEHTVDEQHVSFVLTAAE